MTVGIFNNGFEPSQHEKTVVDFIVDWYVGEVRKVMSAGTTNNAYYLASLQKMNEVNAECESRFNKLFRALMTFDTDRYSALRRYMAANLQRSTDAAIEIHTAKPGQETLKSYLQITSALADVSSNKEGSIRSLNGHDKEQGVQLARTIWAHLRQARLFDFSPEDFVTVWKSADVYTTTKIAKMDYVRRKEDDDTSDEKLQEETNRLVSSIDDASMMIPFPDPLPFDDCFFGFGAGAGLTKLQTILRMRRTLEEGDGFMAAAILGILVWSGNGGGAVEMIQVVERNDDYIFPNVIYDSSGWRHAFSSMAPWVLNHFVSLVHDHRKLVVETQFSPSQKHTLVKTSKRLKMPTLLPKPYYVVRMHKELIEDTGKRMQRRLSAIARELSYRHDRRRHERCYIRRGKLPLEAKDQKKLEDTGYKVWTINEPDSNAYRQLLEREQPAKAPDEWIAILTKWIDDQIVGPESKPYIPAIRMSADREASTAHPHAARES